MFYCNIYVMGCRMSDAQTRLGLSNALDSFGGCPMHGDGAKCVYLEMPSRACETAMNPWHNYSKTYKVAWFMGRRHPQAP